MQSTNGKITIQLYSTPVKRDALKRQEKYNKLGLYSTLVTKKVKSKTYYRVRVGRFTSRAIAKKAVVLLQSSSLIKSFFITRF